LGRILGRKAASADQKHEKAVMTTLLTAAIPNGLAISILLEEPVLPYRVHPLDRLITEQSHIQHGRHVYPGLP